MPAKPLSVLLIDDEQGDRKNLRRLIRSGKTSFDVAEAEGLTEVGAFVGTPDCVIIDYMIGGENGLEAMAAIRTRWPRTAIVMATGHGDEEVAKEAIRNGAVDYISKSQVTVEAMERIILHGVELATLKCRMEDQKRELEHFAHTLAHDLRAPIRAMEFLADCIVEDVAANEMDEVRRSVDDLKMVSRRASNFISTLTQYIRLDRPAVFSKLSCEDAVNGALANLAVDIKERNASVTTGCLPDIWGDEAQITQLFQNLVANAIKFCTNGAPVVMIGAEKDRTGTWVFAVADNGIGINPEYRDKIFTAFQRLHGPETFSGTGLGLSTCAKVVSRHGGRIWCEGEVGKGSIFKFTLPGNATS